MKYLLIIAALVSTSALANRPPAHVLAASAPPPAETFEQMCTKRAQGYGTIESTQRMLKKRDGFLFVVTEDKRKKSVECFVDEQGKLTFNVKDKRK